MLASINLKTKVALAGFSNCPLAEKFTHGKMFYTVSKTI